MLAFIMDFKKGLRSDLKLHKTVDAVQSTVTVEVFRTFNCLTDFVMSGTLHAYLVSFISISIYGAAACSNNRRL